MLKFVTAFSVAVSSFLTGGVVAAGVLVACVVVTVVDGFAAVGVVEFVWAGVAGVVVGWADDGGFCDAVA